MKPKLSAVLLFLLALDFPGANLVSGQSFCSFIETVSRYQDSVRLDCREGKCRIDSATFSLDVYLSFFDKLGLPEGKRCDCIYVDRSADGFPILFLERRNFKNPGPGRDIHSLMKPRRRARENITPEDSLEGYLQYLFFYVMGEQFALYWHANYLDKHVVCSEEGVGALLAFLRDNDLFVCSSTDMQMIENVDPTPVLWMNGRSCTITWIEVETHHGVFRRSYEVSRNHPFAVELKTEIQIAAIDTMFLY
ncbi:MAG: hypothetical protein R2751_09955 [Bacteroidales bacterium]